VNAEDWIREDFLARRREIELRIEQRQQMINFALVALGGLLGLLGIVLRFGDLSKVYPPLLTFPIAIYFIVFCIAYLRHDLFIAYNALYLVTNVIAEIRGRNASLPVDVLTWEEYVSNRRASQKGLKSWAIRGFHIVLGGARILLMLLPGIGALGYGTFLFYPDLVRFRLVIENGDAFWFSFALFVIACCALIFLGITILVVLKAEGELSKAAKDQRENPHTTAVEYSRQIATRLVVETTEAKDVAFRTSPSQPTQQGSATEGDSK